jgi:hypothetical protein
MVLARSTHVALLVGRLRSESQLNTSSNICCAGTLYACGLVGSKIPFGVTAQPQSSNRQISYENKMKTYD